MTTAAATAWPAAKVRQTFTDYFKAREHVIFPSSPVIPPAEETTLLFTNAGMNQFKSIFVGTCAPDSPMGKLKAAGRVANSQKCIRAGGKHNDLDDVGKDTYHHTFFEMLGNWSFGNYFKTEAIEWAWDLLTNVYGLDPSRLYATYFGGNQEQNLPADDEARQLWLRFLPAERVLPFGMKDNFWEMGDTGPCGPCTEIHYDRLGGRDGAKLVNNDDPTLIEIWNLVFMQFNRDEKGGKLTPLPAPCVDTGMGFERLVSVLQDVKSNYDTDVWDLIFSRVHQVTGYARPYQGGSSMEEPDIAYRVIADHIRTLTFALVDGGAPSKDGRGFVLRRIIRRAIRYGREILGAKVGFFSELVDAVSESLGHAFPEVADARQVARAKAVLRGEELLFDRTWEQGLKHFTAASAKAVDGVIAGQDAFILHDRYGFPIDLTQIMAERSRLRVDMAQYESIMEHKKRNASGDKMTARRGVLGVDQIHHLETQRIAGTDDAAKYSWEPTAAKVLAVYNIATQQFVDSVAEYTEAVALVLDRTNFYAESGGQVGDQGHLELPGGKVFLVEDTQKYGAYIAHVGAHQGDARIAVGDSVGCSVDYERRKAIAANHTTTHILNHALREVLIVRPKNDADKVDQKGSLVDERVLRFDFSWGSKLAEEQLAQVEEEVNRQIREGRQVFTQEVAKDEADKICSLRSVFGEKYPAFVRVVSVGRDIKELLANPSNPEWHNYSVEFCGGTHLANSSEAEVAVVIGETALGGNVRRIVLYTQQQARDSIQLADELKAELATIAAVANLKERDRHLGKFGKRVDDASIPVVRKAQLRESIQAAFEAMKKEQKERQAHVKEFGAQIGEQIVKELEASPAPFVVAVLNDYNPSVAGEREATNEAIKVIDKKAPTTAHLLINKDEETAAVTATVPKDKAGQLDAGEWVRTVCGKGGGKPTSAQGAGLPVAAVAEAVEKAKRFAAERLQK